ncbi:hypothetical protein [Sinorhizobium medicae]|uniref:hypothetical protein n=1 Tax=Sinorhizobium TaxID=28105 RepID=UPI000FD91E3D|nr:hypothetical protein [Sinorhizobium medicae]MDX0947223.1 hypothetical protein [Sinorhizobium medicae]RVK19430.1 hypothetical protein CN165_12745 [Sinorhizobium medicae]
MLSLITALLKIMGIEASHLLAGIAGGIVAAITEKNGSIWVRLAAGFVGALTAALLTPLVALTFTGVSATTLNAAAFILGMCGKWICESLIGIAKGYARNPGKLKEDLRAFFLRVLNKDSGDK